MDRDSEEENKTYYLYRISSYKNTLLSNFRSRKVSRSLVFRKKKSELSAGNDMFRHFPCNENPTRALNTTSLKCCLPSTDAIDWREKVHVYVWKFKVAYCYRASKSTRLSQKQIRSDTFLTDCNFCWNLMGKTDVNPPHSNEYLVTGEHLSWSCWRERLRWTAKPWVWRSDPCWRSWGSPGSDLSACSEPLGLTSPSRRWRAAPPAARKARSWRWSGSPSLRAPASSRLLQQEWGIVMLTFRKRSHCPCLEHWSQS